MKKRFKYTAALLLSLFVVGISLSSAGFHVHHESSDACGTNFLIHIGHSHEGHASGQDDHAGHCNGESPMEHLFETGTTLQGTAYTLVPPTTAELPFEDASQGLIFEKEFSLDTGKPILPELFLSFTQTRRGPPSHV